MVVAMIALGIGIASAQVAPPAPDFISDSNANATRQQLTVLLNQYPPTVLRVLQTDPALLSNKDYIAPYPALGAFLAKHPEIVHNAAFFLGMPNRFGFPERSEDRTA